MRSFSTRMMKRPLGVVDAERIWRLVVFGGRGRYWEGEAPRGAMKVRRRGDPGV